MADKLMRLDRFLELAGACKSRSEAKKVLNDKVVYVNDVLITAADAKVDTAKDSIAVNGHLYVYREFRYFLLNKPEGVISATKDRISDTVLSLIPEADPRSYFPVGRLDKDTEGLLLITNDGQFSHKLTSPRKEVPKTYLAHITGMVTDAEKERLESGIVFEDFTSKPAVYEFLKMDGECSDCLLTITEGRFHQVKRMFHAVGHEVVKLKRLSIGGLKLPESLPAGQYLEYTLEQLNEAIYKMD